jgi:hypothetical protein
MITLAILMVILVAVAGFAVDAMIAYQARAMLRSAVDAAVLAAAKTTNTSQRTAAADNVFDLNFPSGYLMTTNLTHTELAVSGNVISMTGSVDSPAFFTRILGRTSIPIRAYAEAEFIAPKPALLLMDEDAIDDGISTIQSFASGANRCGSGSPSRCVNDDIADPGVRTVLFTRGRNVTPFNGLVLPTGQTGDEGLFYLSRPDPQVSQEGTSSFTSQQLIDSTGPAADEDNLDKITGVRPLSRNQINDLVGRKVCALVWDSDISYDSSDNYGVLKGATMGLTAFTVEQTTPQSGSTLPRITINLLASSEVTSTCDDAAPGLGSSSNTRVSFIKR